MEKIKYSNREKKKSKKANWDKTQLLSKLKISNHDKTEKLKLLINSNYDKSKIIRRKNQQGLLVGKTGNIDKQWDLLWAAFCDLAIFLGVIQIFWLPYKPLNHCHGLIHMVLLIQRCAWYYTKIHDTWIIEKAISFSTK